MIDQGAPTNLIDEPDIKITFWGAAGESFKQTIPPDNDEGETGALLSPPLSLTHLSANCGRGSYTLCSPKRSEGTDCHVAINSDMNGRLVRTLAGYAQLIMVASERFIARVHL